MLIGDKSRREQALELRIDGLRDALDAMQDRLDRALEENRTIGRRLIEVRSERDSCREWGALAEDVTARLAAAICEQDSQYRHVAAALWNTVEERDDARRQLQRRLYEAPGTPAKCGCCEHHDG